MLPLKRTLSLALRGAKNYFKKRPFSVSFEVTHSCNARCKHCHLGGMVDEERASPQKLGEICRDIKPLIAQISGGEPLLRKDLEQIVKAFRVPAKAPFIVVTTNASLLTEKKYNSLRKAGVDEFSVSLDYPDERHDEFRGVPGLFGRIESLMTKLKYVKNKGITLCCVIQSDNLNSLVRLAELATEWDVRINFSVYNSLRTRDLSYMLSAEELEEFNGIVETLLARRRQYRNILTSRYVFQKASLFFRDQSIPNCRTGEKFYNVNPDGTFSPCGLIIKDYKSKDELKEIFSKNNTCTYCYTSIRANCEKPLKHLLIDTLGSYIR